MQALHSKDPKKRIVITGIGCCSVFGNDPDVFYKKCALFVVWLNACTSY